MNFKVLKYYTANPASALKLIFGKVFKPAVSTRKRKNLSEADLIYQFFSRKMPTANCMIDVGAHFGESFLPYEKLDWKVYAFEPDNNNRKKITCTNPKTELFDLAISNSDDLEVSFYTSEESTGISGLSDFHHSHRLSQTVKTKTLKTFASERNIRKVDFLKIDTEGYDYFVLQGFDFKSYFPTIILCEFEDAKTLPLGYDYKDLGSHLVNQGYEVYISEWQPIVRYGITHTWVSINKFPDTVLQNPNGWGNFIAVEKSRVLQFEEILREYLKGLNG